MLYQARDGYLYRRFEQRPFPPSDSDSPARAAHVELAWRDPEAAKRERLRARLEYWRRRMQDLHERTELLRALLSEGALEDGVPAADRWRARGELAVARTDELEAAARLNELEYLAGVKSAPLPAAPTPAPLIAPAGPRRPGPRITCQCGTCARCKTRENMRRLRAERKAKAAKRVRVALKGVRGSGR